MHDLFNDYNRLVLQVIWKWAFYQKDYHWPAKEVDRTDCCELFDEEDYVAWRLVQGRADSSYEDKEEEDSKT